MMIVCVFIHAQVLVYFCEYIDSWRCFADVKIFHFEVDLHNFLLTSSPSTCVFMIQGIDENALQTAKRLSIPVIHVNTEQSSRRNDYFERIVLSSVKRRITVADYSLQNIKILHLRALQCGYKDFQSLYLPYLYFAEEVVILQKLLAESVKKYDVVFAGSMSPRRLLILDSLTNNGLSVCVINTLFGKERDIELSKGKILLNLHYENNFNIYEHIRCDRWVFAGQIVVSEDSLDSNNIDVHPLMHFCKYDNLLLKIDDILSNYTKSLEEQHAKTACLLHNIIEKRQSDTLQTLESLFKQCT